MRENHAKICNYSRAIHGTAPFFHEKTLKKFLSHAQVQGMVFIMSKTILLKTATKIIDGSSAIILNDDNLMYVQTDLIGEPDNVFLDCRWFADSGEEYVVEFLEKDNQRVSIRGGNMFLIDGDGDQWKLTILIPSKLS